MPLAHEDHPEVPPPPAGVDHAPLPFRYSAATPGNAGIAPCTDVVATGISAPVSVTTPVRVFTLVTPLPPPPPVPLAADVNLPSAPTVIFAFVYDPAVTAVAAIVGFGYVPASAPPAVPVAVCVAATM